MKTIDQIYKLAKGLENLDVYGLELEIEDIREVGDTGDFSTRPDGSLRNNGTEFVSTPLLLDQVTPALTALFKNIKFGKAAFSERTSIHVHCNMKGCTVEQLKSFILLYMVFENVLFNYVHENRRANIFCVPLKDFTCPERLASSFGPLDADKIVNPPNIHWEKYSALNLLPLQNFGTVEFRHMHGNGDIPYIFKWVEIIHTLKQACRQFPLEELRQSVRELNTSSQYMMFSEKIFREVRDALFHSMDSSSLKKAMYGAVTTAKLWEFHEQKYKKNLEALAKTKAAQPAPEPVAQLPPDFWNVAQAAPVPRDLGRLVDAALDAQPFVRVRNRNAAPGRRERPAVPNAAQRAADGGMGTVEQERQAEQQNAVARQVEAAQRVWVQVNRENFNFDDDRQF